ncbi:hypothetical protein QR680_006497 [Steinernema hermaphroditum]|uniref:Tyrosine-protein phosphatase domain-containing protein n=1 Tax=Steinernema hermaphroditum TaxID=289476 RepID=A0AA39HVN5_9BILA|nr:hypothetical protein QR680_006497 [Steinernema hermaphroditum]
MAPKGSKKKKPPKSEVDKTADEGQSKIAPNNAVAKCADGAKAETEKWVRRALDKGVIKLREEFLELKRYTPPDMALTAFNANEAAGRNRYKDVPCQDKFRIVLKWPGAATDYIHANYVSTPIAEKRFICTQGPLDCTITDFWHMVLQEDPETVIMLCSIVEKGMAKCAQYWPLDEKEVKTYGDIEIKNMQVQPLSATEPNVRFSLLQLKWTEGGKSKEKQVRHYQWTDWPDRGVPPCRLTAMELLSRVRGTKKPIVVHCSAGIGRTGSIVAIEFILERLQQAMVCEDMGEILKDLRNQRPYSIQTDLQYLFVHRIILFYLVEKHQMLKDNAEWMAKYKKFVEEYDKATACTP